MIQPGLIPLQPNLDFMDSFDPLQGSCKAPPTAAAAVIKLPTNGTHCIGIVHTCSGNAALGVSLA